MTIPNDPRTVEVLFTLGVWLLGILMMVLGYLGKQLIDRLSGSIEKLSDRCSDLVTKDDCKQHRDECFRDCPYRNGYGRNSG